jgi:glycerate dehydrogenase
MITASRQQRKDTMQRIVFLDRDSLRANVRVPAFEHAWEDHAATAVEDVVARLAGATVAITNKVPLRADAIARLPDLKMVAVAATGTDNVDLAACRAAGIVVANIRNYSLVSVPEHCFTLILALRRNLRAYAADVEAGKWETSSRFCLLDHPIGDRAGKWPASHALSAWKSSPPRARRSRTRTSRNCRWTNCWPPRRS